MICGGGGCLRKVHTTVPLENLSMKVLNVDDKDTEPYCTLLETNLNARVEKPLHYIINRMYGLSTGLV